MRRCHLLMVTIFFVHFVSKAATLDTSLAPDPSDDPSPVLRDMGVVQNKAMKKRNRFLVSTPITLDFSDGPYTNYSVGINPGYAVSDYFEVYLAFAPFYLANKRSIVKEVEKLTLANYEQARLTAAIPKYHYGLEVIWSPLYGKDSLGLTRIVRSDTFLKLGIHRIQMDIADGFGFRAGVGKTYFMSKFVGLRFCFNYGLNQSVVNGEKSFKSMMLVESGVNFYL